MTGLVRKATLLSVGGLLIAGAAMAGLPNAANSDIPASISIFDDNADVSASLPDQRLVIRDENNIPVPNATVVFDFTTGASANRGVGIQSNCPDASVEICLVQPSPYVGQPGATVGPGEVITFVTDANGELFVTIIGSGINVTPDPAGRPVCAHIYAGSVAMGTVIVTMTTYNLEPDAELNFFDGSRWLDDEGADPPTYNSRSDYQGDGDVDFFDGSLLLVALDGTAPYIQTDCGGLVP